MDTTAAAVARFMSERDLFARHMGIELLELRPGYSRASMALKPYMVNGLGMPHGAGPLARAHSRRTEHGYSLLEVAGARRAPARRRCGGAMRPAHRPVSHDGHRRERKSGRRIARHGLPH